MGGVFETKVITLPNVSPSNDPLGYTCQEQVTVDREFISGASTIVFRVERELAQDNHVAFKKDSIVLLTGETPPIEGGDQLPDTDELEEATLIQPGTYTGSLGEENEEGRRDNYDYYSIEVEEGQLITLQLTVPASASYGISLLTPTSHTSRGSVITQGGMKTLNYVADSTGTWYIKISRSSGQGEYQLAIDIQNQNDAASGQDAGKSVQEAIALSPGTITGFLKAGDNYDYYSIDLQEGQQITLQLTVPANVSYGILLLTPTSHTSRGSVITQGGIKILDYVADSTGTWYIRVSRSSGEGEYQLAIDIQDQNDAGSGQDAGKSVQEAIPLSSGTITGFLKAGDNYDYYSIDLQEGQQITLQLTIPANASYGISLLTPTTHYNRGSVLIQEGMKTLDYVADSTGTWYIKIYRSSGEGEYQLAVNTSIDNDGEPGNNPPVISSLDASQNPVEVNQTVTILCSASDQDTETFTFRWSVNGEIIEEESSSLSWRAPDTAGTYNITCTVSDGRGGEDSESVSIEVTEAVLSCTYTLSGYEWHSPSSGGTGEFTVTPSSSDCQWTAVSDVSWIQINSGGSGPGNKTLSFSVQNNTNEEERIGHITIENKDYTITQGPELELSLSDEGRALITNLPIFVSETEKGSDIDLDGDGILQEWEDKAMEYINPKFDLDEGEEWFDHPEHHVVNFVRVFPYTEANHQYILFTYAVTWSRDYGRTGVAGHNGDTERVIMAWEVITTGGKNLQLRYVFTSAHGGENDHSAVWDAWNRDCFTRGIVAWPFDEEMCGQLVFEENILKLQISEDKHATYPTVSCCEGVTLIYVGGGFVMEDCGGGRENPWRFDCYNAGEPEPNHYLINDLDNPSSWKGLSEEKRTSLTNLFPQEQVWSGNKSNSSKFCGGLGCEGSLIDMDSPGTVGDRLENLPSMLTDKL
jgi:hypothetical protein